MAYLHEDIYPRVPSSLTAETPLTHFHIPVDTSPHVQPLDDIRVQYSLPMAS